jgi:hypothetical protein
MRATKVPLGSQSVTTADRRHRCVSLAAGECGVKDQVSRTQPDFIVKAQRRLRARRGR